MQDEKTHKILKGKKGFTLIELLVVIAILGLLASIIMAFVSDARAKSRDSKRKSDLNEMRLAIEMYYSIHGHYPNPGGQWCFSASCWTSLENELKAEGLISKLPKDPVNNASGSYGAVSNGYGYVYVHDVPSIPQKYDLITRLENKKDPDRCQIKCYKWKAATLILGKSMCAGGSGYPACPNIRTEGSDPNQLYSIGQQ